MDNGQWTTDNGQRTMDNGQRTMDNGQWTMDNGQWTTDNGQQTTDNGDMAGRNVENMRIWQEARVFTNDIYKMMSSCRDYGFRDQIQRASVSIMNNIAEGFESGSDAKFISFLNIAKGSCSEVKSMLYLCEDLNYCTNKERETLVTRLHAISGGIFNLILFLKNKKV